MCFKEEYGCREATIAGYINDVWKGVIGNESASHVGIEYDALSFLGVLWRNAER